MQPIRPPGFEKKSNYTQSKSVLPANIYAFSIAAVIMIPHKAKPTGLLNKAKELVQYKVSLRLSSIYVLKK